MINEEIITGGVTAIDALLLSLIWAPSKLLDKASALGRKVRSRGLQELGSWIARRRLLRRIRNRKRLVPVKPLSRTYRGALARLLEEQPGDTLGDYLEFGVYDGTSLACMHRVLTDMGLRHVRLFGFDSFEGLPAEEVDASSPWRAGEFRSEESFARAVLTYEGVDWDRVVLVRGRFAETLNEGTVARHSIRCCSVIMIDCDLKTSTQQALDFCARVIKDRAVFVFDDWPADSSGYQGENVAFEEFLAVHPEFVCERLKLGYSSNSAVFLLSRVAGPGRQAGPPAVRTR